MSGVRFELQSLRPLLTVADVSGLVGPRVARKELFFGGTKKLKKLFLRKKWPIRPGLHVSHHLNFVRSTLRHKGLEGIRRMDGR